MSTALNLVDRETGLMTAAEEHAEEHADFAVDSVVDFVDD